MNGAFDKIGIALGGGGSLGSYEMGVWTALRELDIKPQVITGTSIGALIGAFMAADKYEVGQSLWLDVSPEKVMRDGLNFEWEALRAAFINDRKRILTFTKRYIKNKGADISPFIELITNSLAPQEIKATKTRFGVVAVSLPFLTRHNVEIACVPDDEVLDWLFASSAIWPLFPIRTFKGKSYIDGGYKDSLPIQFAFDLGASKVIAVNLFYKIAWHPLLNRRSDVLNIEPSWNLGPAFNFDQRAIDRNRKLGYNDAMKKLSSFVGFRYTFRPYAQLDNLGRKFEGTLLSMFASSRRRIDKNIRQHAKGKLPYGAKFLRGLEVLGETLLIDPTPVYEVPDFARLIYDTVNLHFDIPVVIDLLRKVRAHKMLTPSDERLALGAIKFAMETHFHAADVAKWTSSKAKHALAYMMLMLINQEFITPSLAEKEGAPL